MKYRFYGDELQLVRYELSRTESICGEERMTVHYAVTESEKDDILKRYPDAVVTEVDNTGYEWLDGEVFTQEQLRAGELEKVIAMGEKAYNEMKSAPSQEQINAMLMLEIARIKAGVVNE